MQTLRAILSLILCLAVPTAGWASVVSMQHVDPTPRHAEQAHDDTLASAADVSVQGHDTAHKHCAHGDHSAPDKNCEGHAACKCFCGCATGACGAAGALLGKGAGSLFSLSGSDRVSSTPTQCLASAHRASPLRPPIS